MTPEDRRKVDRMFNPRGIAIFGGFSSDFSFGQLTRLAQIHYGYQGKIYPISARGGESAGLKVYRHLGEVEGPVDLASISVPAEGVPAILKECLDHGLAGVQIQSSGFAEVGGHGATLEEEIRAIAAQGLRVVGPNCFGIHSPRGGLTLIPGTDFSREPGSVAMISQSGGLAADFGYEASHQGLRLSKVVSYGNGSDLEAVQLLDYLADDPETEIIAAYVEGVPDGRRFLQLVRDITRRKPVVVWKAGLTPLGGRAVRSHTGSMGGEPNIWQAALTQAGAVVVQGLDEMIDALTGLKYLRPPGNRLVLVGGGGAIGVFSSDLAHRWGLDVSPFNPDTQRRLARFFHNPGFSVANPLDTATPICPLDDLEGILREVMDSEPPDVLVLILMLRPIEMEINVFSKLSGLEPPPSGGYLESVVGMMSRHKQETGQDLVLVLENRSYRSEDVGVEAVSRKIRPQFQSAGIPVFSRAERAVRGIRHALTGWSKLAK